MKILGRTLLAFQPVIGTDDQRGRGVNKGDDCNVIVRWAKMNEV